MKWIGAFILVSVSFFFGQTLSNQEGKKLVAICSLLDFFGYLKRRINSERKPLFQIISEYEDKYLENIGFLKEIRENPRGISQRFQRAIGYLPLTDETNRELSRFGKELGILGFKEQINRIDGIIDFLETEKEKLSKDLPSKQKSIKTICLLFGLLVSIVLL